MTSARAVSRSTISRSCRCSAPLGAASARTILFVSNGHGEAAIADRIAQELHALDPQHRDRSSAARRRQPRVRIMREVGPRAVMPSGGLIAMGNRAQHRARRGKWVARAHACASALFARVARPRIARVMAIGDVFALLMALAVAGTHHVRRHGQKRARRAVRTGRAERSSPRARGLRARRADRAAAARTRRGRDSRPGNVIVDLFGDEDARAEPIPSKDSIPRSRSFPEAARTRTLTGVSARRVVRGSRHRDRSWARLLDRAAARSATLHRAICGALGLRVVEHGDARDAVQRARRRAYRSRALGADRSGRCSRACTW